MTAVRCEDCDSVWLSAPAQQGVGSHGGCLRCDGALHEMTDEELETYLKSITPPAPGNPPV